MERSYKKYEALIKKARTKKDSLTDDAKIAMATCISAVGLAGYDAVGAKEVTSGESKAFSSNLRAWESFVTGVDQRKMGKGVCRDYVSISTDFLTRSFDMDARPVGGGGHAMTELTLGEDDEVRLVEPQWDGLNGPCKLFVYGEGSVPR